VDRRARRPPLRVAAGGVVKRRTKAARREAFRAHAEGYMGREPGWARIRTDIHLGPEAWVRFCAFAGIDAETGDAVTP